MVSGLDHLDPRRQTGRRRFLADGAHLLDFTVDLDEPMSSGEGQRPVVVDAAHQGGQPEATAVLGQRRQQSRAHTRTPVIGQDARGDEASALGVRTIRETRTNDRTVREREQQESVGGVPLAHLRQAQTALLRRHGDADASPGLVVRVGDAGGELHDPQSRCPPFQSGAIAAIRVTPRAGTSG